MMISKQSDLRIAKDIAKEYSKEIINLCYVIKSRGLYYVETSSFCRVWEEIVITFDNGKEIKNESN